MMTPQRIASSEILLYVLYKTVALMNLLLMLSKALALRVHVSFRRNEGDTI